MKKRLYVFLVGIALLFIIGGGVNATGADAAENATYKKERQDRSRTYDEGRVKAKVYYDKIVLEGNSEAVQKINKAIEKDCKKFLNPHAVSTIYETAGEAAKAGYHKGEKVELCHYAKAKVSYNKKGIISIKIFTYWYALGVNNKDVYGLNYSLKTGKKLYLTDVCRGSAKTIKKKIYQAVKKRYEGPGALKAVKKTKVKKFDFFLKEKKAVVCFGPYEFGWGGWYRTVAIESKYK